MEENSTLVEDLVTSLVEVVVDVPLVDLTYALHQEATTTLLVLTSSLMFTSGDTSGHSILKCVIDLFIERKFTIMHPPMNLNLANYNLLNQEHSSSSISSIILSWKLLAC